VVRRKPGSRKLICSGCGRMLAEAYDSDEREGARSCEICRVSSFGRGWRWSCIECAVRIVG
jgi:hypothetical protein